MHQFSVLLSIIIVPLVFPIRMKRQADKPPPICARKVDKFHEFLPFLLCLFGQCDNCPAGSLCDYHLITCTQGTKCLAAADGKKYCMIQGINLLMDCSNNKGTCMTGTECRGTAGQEKCKRDGETGKVAGRSCASGVCSLGSSCVADVCVMDNCITTGEKYSGNDNWGDFGDCCSGVKIDCVVGGDCLCG